MIVEQETWQIHGKSVDVLIHRNEHARQTLLLGPGLFHRKNDRLLKLLADYLPIEQVNVLRFDYPTLPKIPLAKALMPLYRNIVERLLTDPRFTGHALYIGGKSLSARVSSLIINDRISGYIYLGFPLHHDRWPLKFSTRHLLKNPKPMLFIQGGRDPYAKRQRVEQLMARMNPYGFLMMLPEADHSLMILDPSKRSQSDADTEIIDIILWFIGETLHRQTLKQ